MTGANGWFVVGLGRAGLPLATALDRAGALAGAWTRSAGTADGARGVLRAPVQHGPLPAFATRLVLICVPDDRVVRVAAAIAHAAAPPIAVVHTSGARAASLLTPVLRPGDAAGAAHPLLPLTGSPDDAEQLRGAFFAVDGDSPAGLDAAERLAADVGGSPHRVPAEARTAYHAAAALASNGVYALLAAASAVCEGAAMREPALSAALAGLAARSAHNARDLGVVAAATGPIVRGDAGTVAAHLEAVAGHGANVEALYRATAALLVEVANARGLDDRSVMALHAVLGAGSASRG